MTQPQSYDIVGSYNNQRISSIDSERTINMFEYIDPLGKKPKTLISTSGLENSNVEFQTSPGVPATGGFRSSFVYGSLVGNVLTFFHYHVIGNNVFQVNSTGTATKINTTPLATSTGYVGVDANANNEIMWVDGTNGYVFNVGTGTWTVKNNGSDANFPVRPIDICFLDGFLVIISGGTNSFQLSQLNAATVWNSIQTGTVSSHPGTLVACRTLHRRIFFFSQFFTEVWENLGIGTNLPFRRNNALLMEFGTVGAPSVASGFDRLFFLSQDRDGLSSVMMVLGTEAIPVSTRALDFQFAQYASNGQINTNDPSSILIKENGLIFYRLNFTLANATYVYNVTMSDMQNQRWHEEQTLLGNRHVAQTHVFYLGNNYYGNYLNPTLYQVDPNFFTNDGETIKRTRIGKPITPETYQRMRIDRFHLDLVQGSIYETEALNVGPIWTETGIDILTEEGDFLMTESSDVVASDITLPDAHPIVYLSYSKDGGQSYGNRLVGTMGATGQRTFRTVWRKLGTVPRGQSFVPKIEFYPQLPFTILGAAWNMEVMPE